MHQIRRTSEKSRMASDRHLQRNKVKYIADKAALIHSVDSLRLAETINHEGEKIQRVIPVLIEVNVAQEETKLEYRVEETMFFD